MKNTSYFFATSKAMGLGQGKRVNWGSGARPWCLGSPEGTHTFFSLGVGVSLQLYLPGEVSLSKLPLISLNDGKIYLN